MTQSKLGPGPACEINKLIVQVAGNSHPASQRMAFYEHDSLKRLDALTDSDRPESLASSFVIDSTLHVWSWSENFKHRLWLEIASIEGAPIRVPLPEVKITARTFDDQRNQIVPIIPFVSLPGVYSTHDKGTPVICRAGYIYVFLEGRVWRELEVKIEDERTVYYDIDFNRYRMGDVIEPRLRLSTGQALEDIWLPANWNNQQVSLQLCFSEVQLSAPRLRRLELDSSLRAQRCQSPDLRSSRSKFKKLFRSKTDGTSMLEAFSDFDVQTSDHGSAISAAMLLDRALKQHAFPVSLVAPQRARQPGYEWLLDQPASYLCDLSGAFPVKALSKAHQHVVRCEKGEVAYQSRAVETGAWAHWQHQVCTPDSQLNDEFWQAQPAASDVLISARKRGLHGVLLHDSHYRLRHLQTRIDDQQQLLGLCAARATHHAHHASALLVQQLIVPRTIGGKKNPLHKSLDKLEEKGRLDLNRFTACGERSQLWRALNTSQLLLTRELQQTVTEQTLADHLSLEGFDYVAAMHFVSRTFVSLATTPAQVDPLAVSGEVPDALTGETQPSPKVSVGQKLIEQITNDEQHVLHRMLWPALDTQDLDAPYVQPASEEINHGIGLFRPNILLRAVNSETIDPAQVNTLDAHLLAVLVEKGSFNNSLTGTLKATAAALGNFFENLQGSVDMAQRAVQAARDIQPTGTPPAAVMNLKQQRLALAQLRSMLPGGFGAAHFITYQEARNKNLYIFGLSDLPEIPARLRRPDLDYRYASGESMVEAHHHRTGGDLHPTTMVIAMPREHRIAQLISAINRRVNAAWQENMAEQGKVRGNAIQEAVNNEAALKSAWMYKALNSTPFAALVGMLEVWNLRNEINSIQQSSREKGVYRASAGVVGAGADLIIAMEALTWKLSGSHSALSAARKTLFVIPEAFSTRILGSLSEYLVKEVSGRLIAQTVAGSIFVGLNLNDAWHSYQWGDDAIWGQLLMAAGGLTGVASTMTVGGGATLLGLGPLGWITLISISIAAGLVYWLSSTPIEDWLSAGPFGPNKDQAPHLQPPKQAFYYLVSLIADIRITVERNPEYRFPAYAESYNPVPQRVRGADTRIRVESNLPGLLTRMGETSTKASCAVKMVRRFHDPLNGQTHEESKVYPEINLSAYRRESNGLEIFLATPWERYVETTHSNAEVTVHIEWQVRAQITLKDGDSVWVFPAPRPKDPTVFSPAHAAPDFKKVGQLFWADQTINKARADE